MKFGELVGTVHDNCCQPFADPLPEDDGQHEAAAALSGGAEALLTAVEAEAYFSSGGEERPAPKGANGSGNTAAVPRTYPAYVEPQPAPGESREAFLAKMRSIPWWGGGDECEACGGSGKAAPAGVFRWLVDISGEFQDRICALCLALH